MDVEAGGPTYSYSLSIHCFFYPKDLILEEIGVQTDDNTHGEMQSTFIFSYLVDTCLSPSLIISLSTTTALVLQID